MEVLSESNLLMTALGGTFITILINVIKPCLLKKGYNPQIFVVALGLILGILYTAFSYFVPEIYKTAVINFIVQSISTSVFIYEFIWKNIKSKDDSNSPQV